MKKSNSFLGLGFIFLCLIALTAGGHFFSEKIDPALTKQRIENRKKLAGSPVGTIFKYTKKLQNKKEEHLCVITEKMSPDSYCYKCAGKNSSTLLEGNLKYPIFDSLEIFYSSSKKYESFAFEFFKRTFVSKNSKREK